MPNSVLVCSLILVALLFMFCSIVVQAQVVCQSNNCDHTESCCSTSHSCSREHNYLIESSQCHQDHGTQEILPRDVVECQFDLNAFSFTCPNSYETDVNRTVGIYGKPNWVGAEFQSLSYEQFSMTVMWEHKDAETLLSRTDRSSVRGYEIRIYQPEESGGESVRKCLCVTDPKLRNVSGIFSGYFDYHSSQAGLANMIVEVRSYPWLVNQERGHSSRRNCSLHTGCAPNNRSEGCFPSHDDDQCYSWPQSCLNLSASYSSETCAPPFYGPPTNVIPQTSLYYNSSTGNEAMQLDLSWEPPTMNYDMFPVPSVYYISVEGGDDSLQYKAVNTTNITILSLNSSRNYTVYVAAYVPCSGLSNKGTAQIGYVGCGNESMTPNVMRPTSPPPTTTMTPTTTPTPTTTHTHTVMGTPTVRDVNPIVYYITAPVAAIVISILLVCISSIVLIVRRRKKSTRDSIIPNPPFFVPSPTLKHNIRVFVFYPKDTEPHKKILVQTYIVAPLSDRYDAIKEVKSSDDPDFERGCIPESVDRSFRDADYILIVCNKLFLYEWNRDECSQTVQLLKRYMGDVSSRCDGSIVKFITVVMDEQRRKQLTDSRQNLGSLANFLVNETTWEQEIPNIVRYMTGTPLFEVTRQEDSLALLDSPDSPVPDTPDSSQDSHYTRTPRTSNSTLSDTDSSHSAYTMEGEMA